MESHRPRDGYLREDTGSDSDSENDVRTQRLITLQMEALGNTRRGAITEQGYKEDLRQETKSLSSVKAQRRINQAGTQESKVPAHVKQNLSSWNNAWVELSKDGAAETMLDSMNDGQTHRAKLMLDANLQNHEVSSDFLDGPSRARSGVFNRPRGGGRGGRGGGFLGSHSGRHGPSRVPTGIDLPPNGGLEQSSWRHRKLRHVAPPDVKPTHSAQAQNAHREASRRGGRDITPKLMTSTQKLAPLEQVTAPRAPLADAETGMTTSTKRTVPSVTRFNGPPLASPADFMAAARRQLKNSSANSPGASLSGPTQTTKEEIKASSTSVPSVEPLALELGPNPVKDPGLANSAAEKPEQQPAKPSRKPAEINTIDLANEDIGIVPLKAELRNKEQVTPQGEFTTPTARDDKLEVDLEQVTPQGESTTPNAHDDKEEVRLEQVAPPGESTTPDNRDNKLADVSRLIANIGKVAPMALLEQLKAFQAELEARASKVPEQPLIVAPRVVISPSRAPIAVGKSLQSLSPPPSPSTVKDVVAAPSTSAGQETPPLQMTVKPEVSTPTPKAVKTAPQLQPEFKTAASRPTLNIDGSNIFGERIVRDRFRPRQDSLASSTTGTMDSVSSMNASFDRLTLADKIQPRTQPSDPVSTTQRATAEVLKEDSKVSAEPFRADIVQSRFFVNQNPDLVNSAVARQYAPQAVKSSHDASKVEAHAKSSEPSSTVDPKTVEISKEDVKAPTEPVKEGIVQPRFNARQTPAVVDSAVARQYAPQTTNYQQYATTNPFAQPAAATEVRSRATSRTTSTEEPSSSQRETSPFAKRFPTVPYSWADAPRRAATTKVTKQQLPAFLRGVQPSKDPAGAALAQYGGIRPKVENHNPHSKNATASIGSTVPADKMFGEHTSESKS